MKREESGDLMAVLAICKDGSFTRATAHRGSSQGSLSHAFMRLEERLDPRLPTRTTRNVSPTLAGEQLAATLRPASGRVVRLRQRTAWRDLRRCRAFLRR
ncbi:MAG: LysR family transcriptional regulator [Rhodobacteraceae bacterium]|nr:LysR family transcriptional regulator [Paracoccaceae bacterium]